MSRRFLDNVRDGKNDGWRYAATLGVIVYYWLFWAYFTEVGSATFLSALPIPAVVADTISRNVPFMIVLGWLAWAMPNIHERSPRSLVNAESQINLKRVAQGFGVWAALLLFSSGISLWMEPHDHVLQFQPVQWFWLLAMSLLFVPIQTSAEELLFRGYLMQLVRRFTRHTFIIVMISSLLFSAPHWSNPEMARGSFAWGALNYFAWGAIFAVVALKDNGLELCLGVHAANNIVGSVLVTTPDSVIQSPALFVYTESIDPRWSLLALLYDGLLFYSLFFGAMPKRKRTDVSQPTSDIVS